MHFLFINLFILFLLLLLLFVVLLLLLLLFYFQGDGSSFDQGFQSVRDFAFVSYLENCFPRIVFLSCKTNSLASK